MRFAYADPPYLGCCALYGHEHGEDGCCWEPVSYLSERIAALRAQPPAEEKT